MTFRLPLVLLAIAMLAACSDSTETLPAPVGQEEQAEPPAYVGTWAFDPAWCTEQANGFPVTITETRFEGSENSCEMSAIAITPEGAWTARLTCQSAGEIIEEGFVMTPVGDQLALTWPDRGPEATLFTRCE